MFEEGDDILDAVGVGLLVLIVLGLAITALAASTADDRSGGAPDTEFRFETVNESHVQVVYAGGESVDPSALVVSVDGVQRQVSWGAELGAGDRVVVPVRSGSLIRIYYDPGRGDRKQLAQYRVD
jgi:hypothetical protein